MVPIDRTTQEFRREEGEDASRNFVLPPPHMSGLWVTFFSYFRERGIACDAYSVQSRTGFILVFCFRFIIKYEIAGR